MKAGDIVYHPRFGECEIIGIDNETYSIPMAVVVVRKEVEKIQAGQTIYRSLGEFIKNS